MKVRYTRRAARDLDQIFSFIDQHSSAGAINVKRAIIERINQLAELPYIGPRSRSIRDAYELTITRYPYKVFYAVEAEQILILHIRHTARRPWEG